MSQTLVLGKTATSIRTEDDNSGGTKTVIRYHNTDVVEFTNTEIVLNTGGWFTNTTKTRMNQASNQFNLGYRVFQKDYSWFVEYKGQVKPFNGNNVLLVRVY